MDASDSWSSSSDNDHGDATESSDTFDNVSDQDLVAELDDGGLETGDLVELDPVAELDDGGVETSALIDQADAAELEADSTEGPGDQLGQDDEAEDVPIAPGNLLEEDETTGPGWGPIYHGTTEVNGEDVDVTFNMKSDPTGETIEYLISPGHVTKEIHDQEHEHVGGQNSDHPWQTERGLGVLDSSNETPRGNN